MNEWTQIIHKQLRTIFQPDIIILMRKWIKSEKRNESKLIDVNDLFEKLLRVLRKDSGNNSILEG